MATNDRTTAPTTEQYQQLQRAYDAFNEALFSGHLPPCLITLQRQKHVMGYFSRARFVGDDGRQTDEIALNPEFFGKEALLEVLQTIAHEMCHLWQGHFGKPGRGSYHNKEWADKMESIGLIPSDTGKPGGKRTGDKMADYAAENGLFLKVVKRLMVDEFNIPWADRRAPAAMALMPTGSGALAAGAEGAEGAEAPAPTSRGKTKYSHRCSEDALNLWGKPGLAIMCGTCGGRYEPAE